MVIQQWVGWCDIHELQFLDSNKHVQTFGNPFPVDDDGWICPPGPTRISSGTSYKLIDPNCFKLLFTIEDWLERFSAESEDAIDLELAQETLARHEASGRKTVPFEEIQARLFPEDLS